MWNEIQNIISDIKRLDKEIQKLKLFDIPKPGVGGGGGASGDMLKSVYDTDNDGQVEAADYADTVGDHDHSGDAGDGGQFPLVNLQSTGAGVGLVPLADGSGGIDWGNAAAETSKFDYAASAYKTVIATNGYSATYPNQLQSRYDAIASVELAGVEYQAITYWDADSHLVIATRKMPGKWTVYTNTSIHISSADAHRFTTLGLDPNGYIHVCYDADASSTEAMKYRKSDTPISTWTGTLSNTLSMLGTAEDHSQYNFFVNDKDGNLYFFHNNSGDTFFYKYDHATTTWAAAAGTAALGTLFDNGDTDFVYLNQPWFDESGNLHIFWIWTTTTVNQRFHPSYVMWDGTNFHQSDGTAQTVPITEANSEVVDNLDICAIGQQTGAMTDANGRPHMVYSYSDGVNRYIKHAWHNGTSWVVLQFSDSWTTAGAAGTVGIYPRLLIDDDNVAYILYVSNDHPENGILIKKSDPGDFTTWTDQVLFAEEVGVYMPKFDAYQWRKHRVMYLSVEPYPDVADAYPIWVIEYAPRAWATWDTEHQPSLHADLIDDDDGIHWTKDKVTSFTGNLASIMLDTGDMVYRSPGATIENQATAAKGASAVSNHDYTADYSAPKTIDGDDASYWLSYPANLIGSWLKIDLGSIKLITSWRMNQPSPLTYISDARSYRIESSDNGSAWTNVIDYTPLDVDETIDFAAPVTARYFRFTGLTANNAGGDGWKIKTIELIGTPIEPTSLIALPIGDTGDVLTVAAGLPSWAAPSSGDVATDAIWDAKGDLAVGTGANTAAKLTVGTDGKYLKAASGEATGLIWDTPAGTGDVVGPATNTDNAIARFDGADSKTIQNSLVIVDDSGGINIPTGQTYNINGSPHTHAGGSSDFVQLAQIIAGVGGVASMDFTSISGSYTNLRVVCQMRGDVAATYCNLYVTFNNDSGSNYDWEWLYALHATATADEGIGDTKMLLGQVVGGTATASRSGSFDLVIPGYSRTVFHHPCTAESFAPAAGTGTVGRFTAGGHWRSASAITRVTITPHSGNFAEGSIATLYGEK